MERDVELSRLYELIGRLFAEGRDMQALIHQLQQSTQTTQHILDEKQAELNTFGQHNARLQAELNNALREIKAIKNGPASS